MSAVNKPVVLVIDDDPHVCHVVARLISKADAARVLCADCAAAARELLAHEEVDVVLCDYSMPGEDGLSLLTSVAESHPAARRILYSGALPEEIDAAGHPAVDAFLVKPAPTRELLDAVFAGR